MRYHLFVRSPRERAKEEQKKSKRRGEEGIGASRNKKPSSVLFPTDYSPVQYCIFSRRRRLVGQVAQPLPIAAFDPAAAGRRLESVIGSLTMGG